MVCKRELPNLEMLDILIDTCGLDINARELVPKSEHAGSGDLVEGPTALHHLAQAKH